MGRPLWNVALERAAGRAQNDGCGGEYRGERANQTAGTEFGSCGPVVTCVLSKQPLTYVPLAAPLPSKHQQDWLPIRMSLCASPSSLFSGLWPACHAGAEPRNEWRVQNTEQPAGKRRRRGARGEGASGGAGERNRVHETSDKATEQSSGQTQNRQTQSGS